VVLFFEKLSVSFLIVNAFSLAPLENLSIGVRNDVFELWMVES
jgi:hypothetical protein